MDGWLLDGRDTTVKCRILAQIYRTWSDNVSDCRCKHCMQVCDEVDIFRKKIKSCCCLVYPLRRSSGLKSIHHLMSVGKRKENWRTFWRTKKCIGEERRADGCTWIELRWMNLHFVFLYERWGALLASRDSRSLSDTVVGNCSINESRKCTKWMAHRKPFVQCLTLYAGVITKTSRVPVLRCMLMESGCFDTA